MIMVENGGRKAKRKMALTCGIVGALRKFRCLLLLGLFSIALYFPEPVPAAIRAELVVYPYVGTVTSASAVVAWATDTDGSSEVHFGVDQGYSEVVEAVTEEHDGFFWHTASPAGLGAGVRYYYRVFTGGEDLTPWETVSFETQPAQGSASRLMFLALGDGRPDSAWADPSDAAWDIAQQIYQLDPALIIYTGDGVYSGGICSGGDSGWRQYIRAFFNLYEDILGFVPVYPSIGNHELSGGSCGYQAYTDVFALPENAGPAHTEQFYSFNRDIAHFIALDTNQSFAPGSDQYVWLVNDLQNNTAPWTIVYFHHPPYSSGGHGSTLSVQTYLVPLFETYGVDVVFSGHDHDFERTCPIREGMCRSVLDGGIVYYVTGGAGAPLYNVDPEWFTATAESIHHFLQIEIDDCFMSIDAVTREGDVFDHYEIDHCPTVTPSPTTVPTSTPTPTPRRTPTPKPTAGCSEPAVTLWMPGDFFTPGDPCACKVTVCNPDPETRRGVPLFVILDLWGTYYFAPSFSSGDYYEIDLPPGWSELTVVDTFIWPEGAGAASGARWIAGMTDREITRLWGNMDTWNFGWGE